MSFPTVRRPSTSNLGHSIASKVHSAVRGDRPSNAALQTQLRSSVMHHDTFQPRAPRPPVSLTPPPLPAHPTTPSPPPAAPAGDTGLDSQGPDAEVDGWISQAEQKMGRDFTAEEEEAIRIVAYHESRNDPSAINNRPDDVNAQIGDNSVGLMQVTRSNFARYVPGGDPYDPVDSIIAAVRYSDERYGGIDRSKGVVDYQSGAPHQNPYGESNDNYTWY